jgi:hypothetical protein
MKSYSKWIKSLNLKLLEDTEETFQDIGMGKEFFGQDTKVKETKPKTDYRQKDHIKVQSFCTVKETINRAKRPPWNGKQYCQTMQLTKV